MAGISLPLRSLLGSRSFMAQAAGYAYAGLAMAGPWLLTSLHMQLLSVLEIPGIVAADLHSFQAVVLYAYCGSMLLTGALQPAAARHLSDRLFVKDTGAVVPAFTGVALISLILHVGVGAGVVAWLGHPPALALAELSLFGIVGLVSTGMIFLGVLRNFSVILASFAAGMAVALALSQILGPRAGLPGLIAGFAAGHALIAAVFLAKLRAEFPAARPWTFGLLGTAARHPALAIAGLATAAAIWIDKIVFWAGPWGLRSGVGLRVCPLYDNGFFLASFTVLPALVILFIRLEGSFHDKYVQFFAALRRGADLETIRRARAEIEESFAATLVRIAVIQGLVTFAAILTAPALIDRFRLDWISFYVFRASCLGAYVQMMALAVLLSAVHLALYRIAVAVSLTSLLVGAAGAWATQLAGPEVLGFGSVAAGAAALLVGYPWIRSVLAGLERHTFMGQVGSAS
jgi:polysaccharide biosynthesis protein PelG